MLAGIGNLMGVLKQAKEMQSRMSEVQAELATRRYTGEAGGGTVKATVDGKSSLVDIKIDPSATGDVELLEDLVKAAVGAASARSQEAMQQELGKLTGGLDIPGLSEMLGGK
jgi:DNA-binding YbaB/EbfC family protein